MDIVVGLLAILLAAVIGFAVHRASLCNVKAVAELLTSQRAHMLGSFFKTMLWVIVVTAILFLWALWELWRLWRKRDPATSWRQQVLSPGYRLSTAALLLGVANGVLFALFGSWAYTRTARTAVNHVVMGQPGPELLYWLLFAALLAGVLLSSLTNKSFALDPRFRLDWLLNLLGGILMGVGVTLTPGGNDVLILHSIPGGSPHALPAYAALLVGTAAGLMVIRALVGSAVRIECTGDICRTRPIPNRKT